MNKREYKPKNYSDEKYGRYFTFYPWYLPPIKTEVKERLFARGFYFIRGIFNG